MPEQRITPLEIEKAVFSTSFRGYKRSEVDELLAVIVGDYESALQEVNALHKELDAVNIQLNAYKEAENTIKEALVLAQKTADETRANAHKEAEIIINDAHQKAADCRRSVEKEVEALQRQVERMRIDRDNFINEFRALATNMLNRIENAPKPNNVQTEAVVELLPVENSQPFSASG